ncbi:MAG: hypothetical protein WBB85_16350 [Albidovulum sp.]|uniref:hypothetical protein n=1 Tax=Albidovulum sp. TaxID=1872424 RepID=UPI003CAD1A0F
MKADTEIRGEVLVMYAGAEGWWCHSFNKHGDSGQLHSTHRTKREAIICGARLAREMSLDLAVWSDP